MASPFLETVRRDIRLRGYSIKTEKSYLYWIKYYIRFNNRRHPLDMGSTEVTAFLSYLATERNVAINTQKVALNAIVFLYHKVLQKELGDLGFTLATKQRCLPAVLSRGEVARILQCLDGRNRLIVELMYGSGLRISECLGLRVQDVDLSRCALTVRDGKGHKDRQTLLSPTLIPKLKDMIQSVQELLGHNDVKTTQIYTHVLGRHYAGTKSPLEQLS